MLKIEHLSKSFGTKKILDDVSLQIKHGEIAVLLGSSGVANQHFCVFLIILKKLTTARLA